jgi:hypothetical protein
VPLLDLRSLWERLPALAAPANASLTLAGFAPTISTPVLVTPAKASLVTAAFAPAVSTPRQVAPAKLALVLATSVPSVAVPRLVTPAATALSLATFAPTVSATANRLLTPATGLLVLATFAPIVIGTPPVILPTEATGFFETSDRYKAPFKLRKEFYEAIPDWTEEQPAAALADNAAALVALFTAGAITEDEFVALIAA